MKKHEDKEHGKTLKYEAPRRINHKATQIKNNTGITALERLSVNVNNIFNCRETSPWVPKYFLIQKKKKKKKKTTQKAGSHKGSLTQSMHHSEDTKIKLISMMKQRQVLWVKENH